MTNSARMNGLVWLLLVAIGVAGRLGQPDWCITPLAAVTILGGYVLPNLALALSVPLAIMAISDLWLPAYASGGVMVVVYLALAVPALLGRRLRAKATAPAWIMAGLLPAVIFWLSTNFAVWLLMGTYPPTAEGLLACYAAAIPFFRNMLAGDVLYLAVLFGGYAWAVGGARKPAIR